MEQIGFRGLKIDGPVLAPKTVQRDQLMVICGAITGWSRIRQIVASEELASDCIFPLGPDINM
jgi:hypothetical protein